MSAAASLQYIYRYPFASDLVQQGSGAGLRLATSGGAEPNPYFFRGRLQYPKEVADQLLALSQVVASRFYLPGAFRLIDPVVTSNDQGGTDVTYRRGVLIQACRERLNRARRWADRATA